jgi:hypothetical protein
MIAVISNNGDLTMTKAFFALIIPQDAPEFIPPRPVDPGYGIPTPPTVWPQPPVAVWPPPGGPVFPAHPIAPGGPPVGVWPPPGGLPPHISTGPVFPGFPPVALPPIYLPPEDLPPGPIGSGKTLLIVFVPGYGFKAFVVDKPPGDYTKPSPVPEPKK